MLRLSSLLILLPVLAIDYVALRIIRSVFLLLSAAAKFGKSRLLDDVLIVDFADGEESLLLPVWYR